MSKSQTDGFSEAGDILSTGQRGRRRETEVQSMGIGAEGVIGSLLRPAPVCLSVPSHVSQAHFGSASLQMPIL